MPTLLYGLFCYTLYNIIFLYFAGFLLDILVPKAVNDGVSASTGEALVINCGLVFLFGAAHSIMARDSFKQWWTKFVPVSAERSTFVLQSVVFLGLLVWQWRPLPQVLWQFEGTTAWIFYGLFAFGVGLVLTSTFLIDHFELFGLRQVWYHFKGKEMPKPKFRTPFLYRIVRHPMQLGVMFVVFSTPLMTVGHLLLAAAMTLYIVVGIHFEERALVREFGEQYREYQKRTPQLIPGLKLPTRESSAAESSSA